MPLAGTCRGFEQVKTARAVSGPVLPGGRPMNSSQPARDNGLCSNGPEFTSVTEMATRNAASKGGRCCHCLGNFMSASGSRSQAPEVCSQAFLDLPVMPVLVLFGTGRVPSRALASPQLQKWYQLNYTKQSHLEVATRWFLW